MNLTIYQAFDIEPYIDGNGNLNFAVNTVGNYPDFYPSQIGIYRVNVSPYPNAGSISNLSVFKRTK